jgi:hypothetical protein
MKKYLATPIAIALGVALAGVGTVALASRNSSGTHTLASGNPVVSGTSISTTWANNTLGDISQALTDSLDRNGKGGMLSPLRVPNGSLSAPTLSWTNDTDTGLYLVGDAQPAMTVAGTQRQAWTSAGSSVTGTFSVSGASTLTGNTTVGGTLGVTGAATLSGGGTVAGGNFFLTASGAQGITKSNGALLIGPSDANETQFWRNGSLVGSFTATGFDNVSRPITSVATPTNATDAATKGYVDTGHSGAVVASGFMSAPGALSYNFGTSGVTHTASSGVYTVTLSASYANQVPVATLGNNAGSLRITSLSSNSFTVSTFDSAGVAADREFFFHVVRGP